MKSWLRLRRFTGAQAIPVLLSAVLSSCGGGAPSAPGPSAPSPPEALPSPHLWVLEGTVTDVLTGAPVPGAKLAIEGQPPLDADAAGRWRVSGAGMLAARLPVVVVAPGYVTRETAVRGGEVGRQGIVLDLIPDRAPFSLQFFRQLVRDGHERPAELQPLRRWTTGPSFYVNTFNPKTGQPLETSEVALVAQAITASVPQFTGGLLSAGVIESGDGERAPRRGYIQVKFVYDPKGEYCGRAFVGADPGEITINYDRCASACGSLKVSPEVIAHEVGHAMGFWHAKGDNVMNPSLFRRCSSVSMSDAERLHAAVAYRRPRGNLDVDRDPPEFASAVDGGSPALAICRW